MIDHDPYITIDQAQALTGLDRATCYRRIGEGNGEWAVKPSEEKSGNGKRGVLIRVASLPSDAKAKYWAEATMPLHTPGKGQAINLAEITESCRVEALRRLPIVEAAEDVIKSREAVTGRLKALAAQHAISLATLYNWLEAYRDNGFPGLIPQHGKTKGKYVSMPEEVQEFAKITFCQPKQPSPTTVYRRVVSYCEQVGLAYPSQSTLNKFLASLPEAMKAYTREGPETWRREHEFKGHRDPSDLRPGGWICGDHRVFDVFVKLTDAEDAPILRPWISGYIDIRTRLADGVIVQKPSSISIALALRRMIERCGVPDVHYQDRGKDYRCQQLTGPEHVYKRVGISDEALQLFKPGVLRGLSITQRNALPYTPWSKLIESWFGHAFPEWEKTLPGWCGSDAKQRPEKLAGEIKRGELLTFDQFTVRVRERIEEYNRTPHSGEGMNGATPLSLWEGVVIERPSPRALDLLMMRHKIVNVTKQGIRLFGLGGRPRYYWHEDLWQYTGSRVFVRYDPTDLGRLAVYVNDKFICEAVNQEALKYGLSEEAYQAHARIQKQSKAAMLKVAHHRQILHRPEETIAALTAEARQQKVVNLDRPPLPPAGSVPVTKLLPDVDHAASAISASRARSRSHERAGRFAASGAGIPVAGPGHGGKSAEPELSLSDLLDDLPRQRRRDDDDDERDSLMRDLINS